MMCISLLAEVISCMMNISKGIYIRHDDDKFYLLSIQ